MIKSYPVRSRSSVKMSWDSSRSKPSSPTRSRVHSAMLYGLWPGQPPYRYKTLVMKRRPCPSSPFPGGCGHRGAGQPVVEAAGRTRGELHLHAPRRLEVEPPLPGDRSRGIDVVGALLHHDTGD